MDLALTMGLPVGVLARVMTEREFRQWSLYREKKSLPFRRLEAFMAQIAQVIAITMGGSKNATINDFLIEFGSPGDDEATEDFTVEDVREEFGFNPRNVSTEE